MCPQDRVIAPSPTHVTPHLAQCRRRHFGSRKSSDQTAKHDTIFFSLHAFNMGSVVLPHLVTAWHVDQAILSEDERLVVIRFGRDWDPQCMRQDEVLYRTSRPRIPDF
jgi:hypothetical protein